MRSRCQRRTNPTETPIANCSGRAVLAEVERQVTERIRDEFSFVVLGVPDKADRRRLETKMIATVASCRECGPSASWLGRFSPKARIAASGLWLVQGLRGEPLSVEEAEAIRKLAPSR